MQARRMVGRLKVRVGGECWRRVCVRRRGRLSGMVLRCVFQSWSEREGEVADENFLEQMES